MPRGFAHAGPGGPPPSEQVITDTLVDTDRNTNNSKSAGIQFVRDQTKVGEAPSSENPREEGSVAPQKEAVVYSLHSALEVTSEAEEEASTTMEAEEMSPTNGKGLGTECKCSSQFNCCSQLNLSNSDTIYPSLTNTTNNPSELDCMIAVLKLSQITLVTFLVWAR